MRLVRKVGECIWSFCGGTRNGDIFCSGLIEWFGPRVKG